MTILIILFALFNQIKEPMCYFIIYFYLGIIKIVFTRFITKILNK
jgi:hypothetical protein